MERHLKKIEKHIRRIRKLCGHKPGQGMVRRSAVIIGLPGTNGCKTDADNLTVYAKTKFDRVDTLTTPENTTAQNIQSALELCKQSSRFVWVHFSGHVYRSSDGRPLRIVETMASFPELCLFTVDCLGWSPPRQFQPYRYGSLGNRQHEFEVLTRRNKVLCLYSCPHKKVKPQHRLYGEGLTSAVLRALEQGASTIQAVLDCVHKDTGHPAYLSAAGRLRPKPKRAPWLW